MQSEEPPITSPSLYHLLSRLTSLAYTTPPATSTFYADLLYQFFPPDVVSRIKLPGQVSSVEKNSSYPGGLAKSESKDGGDTNGIASSLGVKNGKRRREASRSAEGLNMNMASSSQDGNSATKSPTPITEKNGIDPHIALHAQAMTHFVNGAYYSAIHIVRDHAIEANPLHTGIIPPKSKRKTETTAEGDGMSLDSEGEEEPDFDQDDEDPDSPKYPRKFCMICAAILGKACMELGRYDEGLRIIHRVVQRRTDDMLGGGLSSFHAFLPIPSALPSAASTNLLLAQLGSKSNKDRLHPIVPEHPIFFKGDEEEFDGNKIRGKLSRRDTDGEIRRRPGQSDTAFNYLDALGEDGWLWEAWTGLCDHGDVPEDYTPFSGEENTESCFSPPRIPDHLLPPPIVIPSSDNGTQSSFPHNTDPSLLLPRDRARSPSTSASSPPAATASSSSPSAWGNGYGYGNGSGQGQDYIQELRRERTVSPLPRQTSAFSKKGEGNMGFFTPESGSNVPEPSGPRGVRSKTKSLRSMSPTLSDTSFPNLSISRHPASGAAPPSISSVLDGASADNGLGKPPVAKRARAMGKGKQAEEAEGMGGSKAGGSRHATGRNASGSGPIVENSEDASSSITVRRSSRLKGMSNKEPETPANQIIHPHRSNARAKSDSITSGSTSGAPHNHDRGRDQESTEPPFSDDNNTYGEGSSSSPETTMILSEDEKAQRNADRWLLTVVNRCAEAYREMSRYNCRKVLVALKSLPEAVQRGQWCLAMVARAYYEMTQYEESARVYELLRELDPYRTKDMECYSTVLYHLRLVPTLSHLSQTLISISRTAPSAWIASGNAFSLTGSHEEALRCFKRAFQLDPGMSYAYTLAALEAVEMEEWERGIGWLQMAIRTDIRHYNAWYGLGLIYERTNKLRHAEYHFRRALSINPYNIIMLCCLGTIIEKRTARKSAEERKVGLEKALKVFEGALRIDGKSGMAGFRRVRCLVGLKRYQEALDSLLPLSKTLSSEASVHFLLGKLYHRLGSKELSTISFTKAIDLNPKLANAVKSASGRDKGKDKEKDKGKAKSGRDETRPGDGNETEAGGEGDTEMQREEAEREGDRMMVVDANRAGL